MSDTSKPHAWGLGIITFDNHNKGGHMPNWCYNYAKFSHEDKAEMDKLREAIKNNKVLDTFIPTPQDLLDNDDWTTGWLGWRINNWGSKWDWCDLDIISDHGDTITIQFSTAWSPTVRAYDWFNDNGWWVDAYYSEGGMGFCGHYAQGEDEYYELDEYSKEWMDANIPQDIIDACDLYGFIYDEEEA